MACDYQFQNSNIDIQLSSISSGCPNSIFTATWSIFCGGASGQGNCGPLRIDLDLYYFVTSTGYISYAHQCVDQGSVPCGSIASRLVENGNPYCWSPTPHMGGFSQGHYQATIKAIAAACNSPSGEMIIEDSIDVYYAGSSWSR